VKKVVVKVEGGGGREKSGDRTMVESEGLGDLGVGKGRGKRRKKRKRHKRRVQL
jgi:hypothetical protein